MRAAPTVPGLAPAVVIAAVIVMAPRLTVLVHIRLGRTAAVAMGTVVMPVIIGMAADARHAAQVIIVPDFQM